MIYKEYFTSSEFEDVWHTLQSYYNEPESVQNLYKTLFYTIRNMTVDETHSGTPLTIETDFEGMIHLAGAPDPIEWIVGREVILNDSESSVPELAAHLLYWSTLYSLRHKHVTTKIVSNVSRKDLNPMLLPPPGKA